MSEVLYVQEKNVYSTAGWNILHVKFLTAKEYNPYNEKLSQGCLVI